MFYHNVLTPDVSNSDAQAAVGPVSFPTCQHCINRTHDMVQLGPKDGVTNQIQIKKKKQ